MDTGEQKREFATIEEVFRALPATVQEQCIRVGQYAEALFIHACAADLYPDDVKVRVRLKPELHESVANAARLIHIGKALLPPLYHEFRPDFISEELALYKKYPATGARLAERLLSENLKSRPAELNIILESIENHCEHWNGEGFPAGLLESEIPIIARIVSVAVALDRTAASEHSESPFDFALQQLSAGSGTLFDPVIVALALEGRQKLRRVFTRFIKQTRVIPATPTLVSRHVSRPLALWYRPIIQVSTKKTIAFEAEMRFRDGVNFVDFQAVEAIIQRENLQDDLGAYFVAELCDTLKRLSTCAIPVEYIALTPPPNWLKKHGLEKELSMIFKDAGAGPERVCLIVTAVQWQKQTKILRENLARISRLGCLIMFSGFGIAEVGREELQLAGASLFRLKGAAGTTLDKPETNAYLAELATAGMTILVDGIEKKSQRALFHRNGITCATDRLGGDYIPEDVLVESELAFQAQQPSH